MEKIDIIGTIAGIVAVFVIGIGICNITGNCGTNKPITVCPDPTNENRVVVTMGTRDVNAPLASAEKTLGDLGYTRISRNDTGCSTYRLVSQ